MIFVNHVVILIVDRGDVTRNVATTVRRLEERVKTWRVLLHAMMHVHLDTAGLWLWLREVHTNTHITNVLLVRVIVGLGILLMLVSILLHLHLFLRNLHDAVISSRPHLEWR